MTRAEPLGGLPVGIASRLQTELRRYPDAHQAVLFGSRALGTHRGNSDIDICLDAPDMPFTDYLVLAEILDELVFPYSLDLVLKHHIDNSDLLDHIRRVGVVVYHQ